MTTNTLNKTIAITQQISFSSVKSSLVGLVMISAIAYVALVIMSTATIAHSKALVQDIQSKQSTITELNGELAAKNQTLAEELKASNLYVTPVHTAFIERSAVLAPTLALE